MSGVHAVLLGDSILDNAAYVGGGPDVVAQLRAEIPNARATLLAVDGSVLANLPEQIARVPEDATDVIASIGGNDALGHVSVLERPAGSVGDALDELARIVEEFEAGYRKAVEALLTLGKPLTVCTIYNGAFPDVHFQRRARTALALFNDAILRTAAARGVSVIELRLVCGDPADYANPIEPSVQGGEKIARAIARCVGGTSGGAALVVR